MIKGAFVFGVGLVVGTGYGFMYGLRFSKALEKAVSIVDNPASAPKPETVVGATV